MLAQWTPPRNSAYMAPPSNGLDAAMTVIGAVVLVAGAAVLVAQRRSAGPANRGAQGIGRWLLACGLTMAVGGGALQLIRVSSDRSRTDALHAAGQQVIDQAVSAAEQCATTPPQPPVYEPGMGGLPGGYITPPPCQTSPRETFETSPPQTIVGASVYSAELSESYEATGQVQVTEMNSGQSVCVTVPTTVTGSGTITAGPCPD